ncbi:MAG: hypothetical protein ABW318_06340, partial [Vicinamibacterales bacterium]
IPSRRVPASKDPHGPFPSVFPPPSPRPAFAGREEGVAMGRFTWIAGLVLCVGLADRQTASGQPLIHVLLVDQAEVPPDTRQLAQDVAMRVFHLSGLALVWVDAGTCPARCLTVRIVTEPVTAQSRRDPHILGVAPSMPEARGIILWVFYPRIRALSAELGMDASQLLGHAMAHELGHLLLPYGAHSLAGLMRGEWDRAQVRAAVEGLLTFTPDQAGLIREGLQASASPTAHAR